MVKRYPKMGRHRGAPVMVDETKTEVCGGRKQAVEWGVIFLCSDGGGGDAGQDKMR